MSSSWLRQSTPFTFTHGPFVDPADGRTPMPALTIGAGAIYVSKNGAAMTAKSDPTGGGTGSALGFYSAVLNATDTGLLGPLRVYTNVVNALPVWRDFQVLPPDIFDALADGSILLRVSALQINNSSTAAQKLARAAIGVFYGTTSVGGGTINSFTTPDILEATPEHFKGRTVTFTSGALNGQSSVISAYALLSSPSRGQFTVANLTEIVPDGTDFTIN
jgi:hypothetical protein